MKKRILGVLLVILTTVSIFAMTACEDIFPIFPPENGNVSEEYKELYELYVEYVQSVGEAPVTYEEWISSLIGYDGEYIEPTEGKNGNWWIGDVDTGIPVCNHVLGQWEVIHNATCVTEGKEKRNCTLCNYYETRTIEKTDHILGEKKTENVTSGDCKTYGSYDTVTYCDYCGIEISRETISTSIGDHNKVELPGTDATCHSTGLTSGEICDICGDVLTEQKVLPIKDHTPDTVTTENIVHGDCLNDGSYDIVIYCTDCNEMISKNVIIIPASGHIEVINPATPPTCANVGYTEWVHCSECGEVLVAQKEIGVLDYHIGDTYKSEMIISQPSCQENGYKAIITFCTTCNEEISRTEESIPATEHPVSSIYEDMDNYFPACCEVDGSYDQVKYCGACNREISRVTIIIPATGHLLVTDKAVDPDCENTGLTEGSHCDLCRITLQNQEVIPATGHNYKQSYEPGSCQTRERYYYVCEKCEDDYIEYGELGDHIYDSDVCRLCQCTHEEYFTFKLMNNGTYTVSAKDKTNMPANIHIPGVYNGKPVTVASGFDDCDTIINVIIPSEIKIIDDFAFATSDSLQSVVMENGVERIGYGAFAMGRDLMTVVIPSSVSYIDACAFTHNVIDGSSPYDYLVIYCQADDKPAEWNDDWNNLGCTVIWGYNGGHLHIFSSSSVVEPTCKKEGYTIMTCDCGHSYRTRFTDPTDHDFSDWIVTDEPSCTEWGHKYRTCNNCTVKEVIDVINPHELGEWSVEQESTCTEYGYLQRCCANCDYKEKQDTLPLGHSSEWRGGFNATCTEEGLTDEYACTVCGEVSIASEIIPALGHEESPLYGYSVGCLNDGLTDGVFCYVCDEILIPQVVIPAHGHMEDEPTLHNRFEPDCENIGYQYASVYCFYCGTFLRDATTTLPSLGHTEIVDEAVEPTCSTTGLTEGAHCSVCQKVTIPQNTIDMTEHTLENWVCVICGHVSYNYLSYVDTYYGTCYVRILPDLEYPADLIIPDTIYGLKVVGIYVEGFARCYNLVSITLPDSLEVIDNGAFYNCTNLTTIIFGENSQLKKIGDSAFIGTNLTGGLVIPTGVTEIGPRAFYACSNITGNVVIPDGVSKIDDYAFYGCKNITEITFGDESKLEQINMNAFQECTSLKRVSLGDNCQLKRIEANAFEDCSSLESFTIIPSVDYIGSGAFIHCDALANVYVTSLDNWYKIVANEPNTDINNSATMHFLNENGTEITHISIPNTITNIANMTFQNARNVRSFNIPDTVTYIGVNAFLNTAYYLNESNWEDGVLYIGKHLVEGSLVIEENYKVKEGTLTLSSHAFANSHRIKTVTLPESLVTIGDYAFFYCLYLEEVNIPSKITDIYEYTFAGCEMLQSIEIPYGVRTIGNSAFMYCRRLTSIVIPESVYSIGDNAFVCQSLVSITLPDSITYIGLGAFHTTIYDVKEEFWEDGVLYIGNYLIEISDKASGTITVRDGTIAIAKSAASNYAYQGDKITTVIIPDSLKAICDDAFESCINLKYVIIGENSKLEYIGADAFTFTRIEEIYIPASVTTIGVRAFSACTNLKKVTFGENSKLTEISDEMFSHCTKLESIEIPNNVTRIGKWAFSQCESINSIVIPDSVIIVDANSFNSCTSLKSITIGKGVKYFAAMLYNFSWVIEDIYVKDIESWLNIDFQSIPNSYTDSTLHFIDENGMEITDIVIPESVTVIPDYAFMNAKYIKSITLHDKITYIGKNAFYNCSEVESICIPESVTYIGSHALMGLSDSATAEFANPYGWNIYRLHYDVISIDIDASLISTIHGATTYLLNYYPDCVWERK